MCIIGNLPKEHNARVSLNGTKVHTEAHWHKHHEPHHSRTNLGEHGAPDLAPTRDDGGRSATSSSMVDPRWFPATSATSQIGREGVGVSRRGTQSGTTLPPLLTCVDVARSITGG